MTTFENLTKSQKVRASFHRDVQAICKEISHNKGFDITTPSMEIIAELIYKKLCIYALDLEAFAKHAKRSTINTDDVLLLVRRNPSLKAHLSAVINKQPSTSKNKRRKTNVKETPTAKKTKPGIESEKDKEKVKEKKDKETEVETESKIDDVIKDMSIDGTIDLTFD